jgi:predicted DNA-binding transcriptional regulator YafY
MTTVKARHLLLVLLLQANGKQTASTLGHWLGVHPRTIARHADDLEQIGIQIRTVQGALGGFALEPDARVWLQSFIRHGADDHSAASADELRLRREMRELIERMPAALRPDLHARLDQLVLEQGPAGAPPNHSAHLTVLRRALWSGSRVAMQVRIAPDASEWRTMDPLVVTFHDDVWYFVGVCVERRLVSAHALSDILDVRLLDQPAKPPDALFARRPAW